MKYLLLYAGWHVGCMRICAKEFNPKKHILELVSHCFSFCSAMSLILNMHLFLIHGVKGDTGVSLEMLSTAAWGGLHTPCAQCFLSNTCSTFGSWYQSAVWFALCALLDGVLLFLSTDQLFHPTWCCLQTD